METNRMTSLLKHGDKILFTLASLYFLSAVTWLVSQNRLKLPFLESNRPSSAVSSPSDADKAFIAYLQARLAMLPAISEDTSGKSPQKTENLPPIAINPPPAPPKPVTPSVIERVYIPLYPDLTPSTSVTPITPPSPPRVSQPAPPPQIVPPAPPKITSVPILTPRSESQPQTTAFLPSPVATLVGVLADGDRSYAIFQVKGKAKQVRMGETVGTSAWTLVGVENQRITLEQAGKKRILEVGDEL